MADDATQQRRLRIGAIEAAAAPDDANTRLKVLIRPVCGCCGNPMILGRSVGKYQSFFCFNANNGIHGCTNRGYKSARIIDEAVLGVVMATLFTDGFLANLTADVNKRLAELDRRPIPSTKKLEEEIANEDRQLKRLVDGQAKPQMVARFTINAVPALAVLDRGGTGTSDGAAAAPWDAICHKPQAPMGSAATPRALAVPLTRRCHRLTSDVLVTRPADPRPPQAS